MWEVFGELHKYFRSSLFLGAFALSAFLYSHHNNVYAGQLWAQDSFNASSPTQLVNSQTQDTQVNYTRTTADVALDMNSTTQDGTVTAGSTALPDQFQMIDSSDYAVGTVNGVDWVKFNQSTGKMQVVTNLSVPSVTPLSLAVDPSTESVFLYNKNTKSIQEYSYNGTQMSQDTLAQVSVGAPVISMSYDSQDKILFTEQYNSSHQPVITGYSLNATGTLTALPGLNGMTLSSTSNNIGITSVEGTPNFIASNGSGSYYYAYDSSTNTYQSNPSLDVAFGSNVVGFTAGQGADTELAMTPTSVQGYVMNSTTGQYQTTSIFSPSGVLPAKPYDISMVPGSNEYTYGILSGDGSVHYYAYNFTTGQTQEATAMDSSGYQLVSYYGGTSTFETTALASSSAYQEIQFVTDEALPTSGGGTSAVTWQYSTNGGSTWYPITLTQESTGSTTAIDPATGTTQTYSTVLMHSAWLDLPSASTSIQLQATLTPTPDQLDSPVVFSYELYGTSVGFVPGSMQVTQVTTSNPSFTSSDMNTFPLPLYEGDRVVYTIQTTGTPNPTANPSTLVAQYSYNNGTTLTVPPQQSSPTETSSSVVPNPADGSSDVVTWTLTYTVPQTTTATSVSLELTANHTNTITNQIESANYSINPFATIGNTSGTNVTTYLSG